MELSGIVWPFVWVCTPVVKPPPPQILYTPQMDAPVSAAYVASSLTYMLDGAVDLSVFYPGCNSWGLWSDDTPGKVRWRPMSYAYEAFTTLQSLASVRLNATMMPDEPNYSVLAAAGPGVGDGSMQVGVERATSLVNGPIITC